MRPSVAPGRSIAHGAGGVLLESASEQHFLAKSQFTDGSRGDSLTCGKIGLAAYGLHQVSVEVDGKEPSPKELSAIISKAKETGAKVIFVQPQFSEKSAAVIAQQIGAQVVRLDPLAEDWEQNMLRAARAFADALK